MDTELQQLIAVYRTEAAENLATMEQALLALEERGDPEPELLMAVLRAAHTLKGNSAIVGFDAVTAAAHALEGVLEQVQGGVRPFDSVLVTELLEAVDALRALVSATEGDGAPQAPATTARSASLRVNVGRLDTLLTLTGEIAIARGRLGQLVGSAAAADPVLGTTLWQLEQLHGALQGEVMALRMVPLGPTFRAHHRTVRDIARQQGREARLVIEGDEVEVDTSIAEQMRDPLTHMIRNAVDHGLETPAERAARGKPATGTITLRAVHQPGAVLIELSDDGRGLDRARIAARAEALGLVADAAALGDEQLLALIFESGFSTADAVTAVSGRGVGMDVVRRHIRALRGTIVIASTPGRGTTFTIRLPLTVAMIDGFAVRVGDETYVLPLETVVECVDFGSGRARRGSTGHEGVLDLRGTPLPYAHLREVLGLPPARDAGRASVVVVRHGERRVGLVVDALDGDAQAVIKPLTGALQQLPGIAGSTILGTGRVALILHVPQLVDLATRGGYAPSAA